MHKSIDDMRKLMDEQGTPYLDVTDIQYIRFSNHIEDIGLNTTDGKFLNNFDSFAAVSEEHVKYVWREAGVDEVPPNIGMEIFTSILCAVSKDELTNIFQNKNKTFSKRLDLMLQAHEISPTHIKRFMLDRTMFSINLQPSKRKNDPATSDSQDNSKKQKIDKELLEDLSEIDL